ncbi:methyltransferase domain-containing protein [Candidatus Desantisbacteria bacterium]|nr:methyltransferase domain-containing protein [Candidatus Desantisbacteria bacterium]
MHKTDFSKIAKEYENNSLVQKSAAEILIQLLNIGDKDDILDLGCGTGNITKNLQNLTSGNVYGVDPSEGMVKEAQIKNEKSNIHFELKKAEKLDYINEFDVIFCNSVFQWFKNPETVINGCYKALKKNGKIGIQSPATQIYSPNFIKGIEAVKKDSSLSKSFAHFKNPWFFLDTEKEYKSLFEQSGFEVPFVKLYPIKSLNTPDEAIRIFESGAAIGYLNQNFYDISIDNTYTENFRKTMKNEFKKQSGTDGLIELIFNRIFLVGVKE